MRNEETGVKKSNEGDVEVKEDDSVEILDDSIDEVKEEESREEDGDDIWDNMVIIILYLELFHWILFNLQVVIDHKKRKTKEKDMSKSKRLKWEQ